MTWEFKNGGDFTVNPLKKDYEIRHLLSPPKLKLKWAIIKFDTYSDSEIVIKQFWKKLLTINRIWQSKKSSSKKGMADEIDEAEWKTNR